MSDDPIALHDTLDDGRKIGGADIRITRYRLHRHGTAEDNEYAITNSERFLVSPPSIRQQEAGSGNIHPASWARGHELGVASRSTRVVVRRLHCDECVLYRCNAALDNCDFGTGRFSITIRSGVCLLPAILRRGEQG